MRLEDVTLVVPTRNESKNIAFFLASLPPTLSLVVVDSSDDDTPSIISQLRPVSTLVLRQACNISQARQLGAETASTPWVLFTDADVEFAPDYFERLGNIDGYDAVYGPKLSLTDITAGSRTVSSCRTGLEYRQRLVQISCSGGRC